VSNTVAVETPAGGWHDPWPRVFELTGVLPADRWALVGGLMVQAHAFAAEIETTRVTIDVDAAVRVEAGVFSYSEAAAALNRVGYALDTSTERAYRYSRGADIVDLMVPDHERPPPRHALRDVMPVTAGKQAMRRLQFMHFDDGGVPVAVPVPNLHGALVLKAAALQVDQRDRARHLLDAITLMACIEDVEPIVASTRGSDRQRLMYLLNEFDDQLLIAAQAPTDTVQLARRTAEDLRRGLT